MTEATKKEPSEKVRPAMVECIIDDQKVSVPKGTTVLMAAKSLGIEIPTFCWHPKLKPVGACRMCYVEIEKMSKLQVSCATEVGEGMVVHTDSDQVRQGRRAVLEFTLINHPLDCPTCDKGGECDLQDVTFDHGIDDSRFGFSKQRFVEQGVDSTFDDLKIGPEIVLNRNRCILCYKCVRANKEAFGEYDLGAYERGNITEINAAPGQEVDNPFSGNLVEICPVGALTNSDWRYKVRVWLTQTVSSICNFTSSGNNVLFYCQDQKNHIYRVTSRPNDDIDDGWMSDITRYGYQIVNSPDRLATPLIRKDGKQVPATWDEALALIKNRFGEIREKKGTVCLAGLVSPNLDNLTLYSVQKFFRSVIRCNNIDYRCDYRLLPDSSSGPYGVLASRPFKISNIDDSDVIVVFGSDILREYPNEYLRLRKASNFANAQVYLLNPYAQKAGEFAERELVYRPGTDEQAINALCLVLVEEGLAPGEAADELRDKTKCSSANEAADSCGLQIESLRELARAIAGSRKPTVIIGDLIARSSARDQISAAVANLNRLAKIEERGQIAALAKYANSAGAERLGVVPSPIPVVENQLRKLLLGYPESAGLNCDAMLAAMTKGEVSGLFVMGANPILLYPDGEFARESLERVEFLVACDLFETETTALADVVLPLSSWAEYDGEYINLEGRRQRAHRAIKPVGQSRPGYAIMDALASLMDYKLFESDSVRDEEVASLLGLNHELDWPADFQAVSAVVDQKTEDYPVTLFLCDDYHHRGHLTEKSPSLLNFSSEAWVEISSALAGKLEVSEGDLVRLESPTGKILVPARVSKYLNNHVALLPRNFSSTPVTALLMRKRRVDRVKITRVEE